MPMCLIITLQCSSENCIDAKMLGIFWRRQGQADQLSCNTQSLRRLGQNCIFYCFNVLHLFSVWIHKVKSVKQWIKQVYFMENPVFSKKCAKKQVYFNLNFHMIYVRALVQSSNVKCLQKLCYKKRHSEK